MDTQKPVKQAVKRLANGQFAPGVAANPRGRPKKEDCLVSCIKDELAKISSNGVSTNEQLIAGMVVQMAQQGNLRAIEICLDYVSGKPVQMISGVAGGEPVIFKVIYDN